MNNFDAVLQTMDFEFFASGKHKTRFAELAAKRGVLLDVRSEQEAQAVKLQFEGLIDVLHIPTHLIPERLDEIPSDRPVGIFCSAGMRAAIVYAYLRAKGFENVAVVAGGYQAVAEFVEPAALKSALQSARE